jgi:hypothetical protein
MKTTMIILASCTVLALPVGTAAAGQCTSEIDNLSKVLAAQDAGSGPTPGAPLGAGQHPPTTAMSQADQSGTASSAAAQAGKTQHPPTEIMNRETTGSAPPAGAEPKSAEHPPTAAMNQQMQGGAASPQDVQRQTQGQPTAAQQAQGQISESHGVAGAMAALERARMFDQHGREGDCLGAVGQAKLMSGAR